MASKNITWHPSTIGFEERKQALNAQGLVLWLTGLSGSGKSTIARELEFLLVKKGVFCTALDGDNVRFGLNSDLGFTKQDRKENIRRVGEVAKLIAQANVIVIAAFISPYANDREQIKKRLQPIPFIEVFIDTPLTVCQNRDPKGLYKRALSGEIPDFTGISAPYEPPVDPDIRICAAQQSPTDCAKEILQFIQAQGYATV